MVSDFICSTEEQHKVAKEEHDRDFPQYAREVLHLRQQNEGYWNNEQFICQVRKAARIAFVKYPWGL